jgi:hypothetical protein
MDQKLATKPADQTDQTGGLELNMGVILATDPTNGLKTAIEAAVDPTEPPVARAEQLPLLPSEQLDLLPTAPAERVLEMRAPRKAGRPAGAINRSTKAWREYLGQRYRSPLEVLAETYSRPTMDLALELGCTLLEAYELQRKCAVDLAPYMHGKMPIEVELNGGGLVQLVINTGLDQVSGSVESDGISIEGTIVSNQDVNEDGDGQV